MKNATQKLATLKEVEEMALKCMGTNYHFKGIDYNAKSLGYRFSFSNKKRAWGTCYYTKKQISLSKFLVQAKPRTIEEWHNTMIHEIAHAIAYDMGSHGHTRLWRSVFLSMGGNGERASDSDHGVINPSMAKYTLTCPNGHVAMAHKSSRKTSGQASCGECSKVWDSRFLLKVTKNY